MNLKRLRGIATAAFITTAAVLLAGCMNDMAGSVEGDSRMATLSLSATGIPNDYAEQFAKSYPNSGSASRSITPNDPYKPGSTGLTFYLSGTSETGKKLADMEVTLKLKDGSTTEYEFDTTGGDVSLPSMSWNLVLTAYTDGSTKAKPVLQGFCSVDLRNGSGTATFTLSPDNIATPGSVKITGKFNPYSNVDKYTMGIYKRNSASEAVDEQADVSLTGDGTAEETFTYTCASVAPGTYLYKIVFKNADGTITGSFIDTLVVDAGNALVRDIGTIDVVNKKPGVPSNFTVSLEDGSESSDDTYRVKLAWTSGGGETNFEVELTEYSDGGTTAATGYPKIYGMSSMDKGAVPAGVVDFQGSPVWAGKGGAMTYGDTEAYFKFKLGVVYEMRIRARNYVGTSDWADRSAAATATGFTPYGTEKINRMKVKYLLNGGTLVLAGGGASNTKTINYTEYKNWAGTDIALLKIDNNDADANQLNKGGSPFKEWVGTAGTAVTESGYQNLSVTANFGSSVDGSIGMADEKKDVALGDITATYGTAASPTANTITLSANGTHPVPKTTGTPAEATNLKITLGGTGYTNIKFELTDNGKQSILPFDGASTNSCKLVLDNYATGKIQVRVIADTSNATGMSQTLTFDLQ